MTWTVVWSNEVDCRVVQCGGLSGGPMSGGLLIGQPGCPSRGQWFYSTCNHFKTWAISFTPLLEETLKAVSTFYMVSVPGEVKDPMQGNDKNLLWTD